MIINLDQIKQFCNIEIGYQDDDLLLDTFYHQAHKQVAHDINRPINICDEYIDMIKIQILYRISTWYANREITGIKAQELPKTYDYLINAIRSY